MTNRVKFLTILLALTVISTLASIWLTDEDTESDPVRKAHKPDYYMENFSTLTMNQDGSPKNKVSAEFMAHYQDDDTTELLQPNLELFHADKPPTYVTAEKGWITSNNEVILLSGAVHLNQDDKNGRLQLQVDTSDVKILLDEDYIETEKHAVITNQRTRIETIGLRAYMNENRIELLSHVRGKIEPE